MRIVHIGLLAVTLVLPACEQSPPPSSAPAPEAAAAPENRAPAAQPASAPREPLPREAGGLSLGITQEDAAAKLGKLDCHENPQGFRVCVPTAAPPGAPSKLEVYVVHDRIVSLSYESDIGPNVWDFLNGLITRYGAPSLNGTNERDKQGRTHEIYGWKDDQSIYSVRFIWQGDEGSRQLSSTAIALWDRKVFQQWEDEKKAERAQPPAAQSGEST